MLNEKRESKLNITMNFVHGIAHSPLIFVLVFLGSNITQCEKEVFSSLAQLENLWIRNIVIVRVIEDIIKVLPNPPIAFTR